MNKILSTLLFFFLCGIPSHAAISMTKQGGWYESCWMEFSGLSSEYTQYKAYVSANSGSSWTLLDGELIRSYGTYGRVDALGLTAGNNYRLKIVPVKNGTEVEAEGISSSEDIVVKAFDRSGFAHHTWNKGVGAYNDEGTLKANTQVLYVTAETAKTVKMDVVADSKGNKKTFTGLQSIISAYQKGLETRPLCVRFLGRITAEDMDGFDSSSEGIQIKGKTADSELNMTFEGVGNDAFLYGFGFLVRNSKSVEMRNFGIATLMDDDISLDTDNSNIWIHNVDVFYGKQGGGDHAKGDGAIDIKSDSKYVTVSYAHFWDTGKSTMCGMKSESGPNYITYHHNWFDHSDSRHARIRTMSVHMYNNFYDAIAKYGVGACTGSSVFVEANYFNNCSKPMLISMQGTDTKNGTDETDAPTFSKEDGGIIKSFANYYEGSKTLVTYSATNKVHFDCYEAASRDEKVPSSVTAKKGGTKYDNFDTSSSLMYSYTPDNAADVKAIVSDRSWGAGRMQGGDFDFSLADQSASDYAVNPALRSAIDNYRSKLVQIIGIEGGGSVTPEPVDPGDTRAESTFALVSDAVISINQNAVSQITVQNAAGTVTYTSNNENIATVDADGNITALNPGKTLIVITDAGSTTVKGATLSVTVNVIGVVIDDGDVTIQCGDLPYGYEVDESASYEQFTYNTSKPEYDWLNKANLFKIGKGQHIVTLPDGVKVTKVIFYGVTNNNEAKAYLTELAGKTYGSNEVNLPSRKNGTALKTVTLENLNITNQLTFTITYAAGVKLSLVVASDGSSGIQEMNNSKRINDGIMYDIEGRRVLSPQKGRIYIQNGRKHLF